MKNFKFKKMLSLISILTITIPATFMVVACKDKHYISSEIKVEDKKSYQLNDGAVNTLIKATDGNIYAATSNANIWKISSNQNPEKLEILKEDSQLFNETINILFEAKSGKIYAGTTSNRVWEISLENNSAILKLTINAEKNYITTLVELTNGEIYAGTGIGNIFEVPLANSKGKIFILKNDFYAVSALVESSDGFLYVATKTGNIWKIDLKEEDNESYDKIISFKDESIFDMKQINDNQFILATQNKIYQYNLDDKKITEKFILDDSKDSFLLIKNTKKEFYIITTLAKLYQIDLEKNKLNSKINLKDIVVYSLLVTDNNIYLGTEVGVKELLIVR